VEAVQREFSGRNVGAYGAARGRVGDQAGDELAQVLVGGGDVLAAVQHGGEAGVVRAAVGDRRRVGRQDGRKPRHGSLPLVAHDAELLEVLVDLAFVPRAQDRLDVGEVLVQRRPPDAGVLGDL
jgi:hypothetical protein